METSFLFVLCGLCGVLIADSAANSKYINVNLSVEMFFHLYISMSNYELYIIFTLYIILNYLVALLNFMCN